MRSTHLITLAAASLLSLSAQAAPIFYNTEASFLTATSALSLTTEAFNSYSGSPTSTINNFASGLNISSNVNLFDQNGSSYCAGTGNCIYFTTPAAGSRQTFSFDSGSVNAFGIFLGDLATVGTTTLTLTTSNGVTQSYNLASAASANERYFGITDLSTPFTSVTLRNSRDGDIVYIDNVSWGKSNLVQPANVVPEPGMLALLGVSFAGVALVRRRRA